MNTPLKEVLERFARGEADKSAVLRILSNQTTTPAAVLAPPRETNLETAVQNELMAMVSEHLKVARSELDPEAPLEEFGFDSISLNEFASKLEARWSLDIAPADLVECNSIGALARFFSREYADGLGTFYKPDVRPETPPPRQDIPEAVQTGSANEITPSRSAYPPIAVIGMSANLPGSPDLDSLWRNLVAEKDLISEFPKDRHEWWHGFEEAAAKDSAHMPRWAGTIDSIDRFDTLFFNISPKEAELMDPQQRLLLQIVWHALEDAGLKPSELAGSRTGFFAGVAGEDYMQLALRQCPTVEAYLSTGCNRCVLANRVSYFYNWRGPNEAIDTACSSSLVAVHRAIKAMHNGECDLAVAAGVCALLCPLTFIAFGKAGMLAPDGRCKPFDERADGYVRSEGVGAVVLKRLDAAIEDGDSIYAVIRGSSSNHGGHTSSLTVPSDIGQAECLRDALANAAFDPLTISYIEAHGTGTKVGDPVEIKALRQVLANGSASKVAAPHCAIGSIKGNLGHLEGAAGIAGLIKVALALHYKCLPGAANFQKLNSKIDLASTHLQILQKTRDWTPLLDQDAQPIPRRAGVNSFGFGGSNAHVVLEEFLPKMQARPSSGPELIVLSAKNADRLKLVTARLLEFLKENPRTNFASLGCTLQLGREEFPERLAVVASDLQSLEALLQKFLDGVSHPALFRGRAKTKSGQQTSGSRALESLAEQWVRGAALDWRSFRSERSIPKIRLPNYPFEQKRFWLPLEHGRSESIIEPLHPLLDRQDPDEKAVFYKVLTGSEFYLQDHRFADAPLLPGVAYIEMAWAAVALWFGPNHPFSLRNVAWVRPVRYEGLPVTLRVRITSAGTGVRFEIASAGSNGEWNLCAQGKAGPEPEGSVPPEKVPWQEIRKRATRTLSGEEFYPICESRKFKYGPSFQVIQRLWANNEEFIAHLKLPARAEADFAKFVFHPAMLDGSLQGGIAMGAASDSSALPFALGQIQLFRPLQKEVYVYGRRLASKAGPGIAANEAFLLDADGNVLAMLGGFLSRVIPNENQRTASAEDNSLLYVTPSWKHDSNVGIPLTPGPILLFDNDEELARSMESPVIRVQSGATCRAISDGLWEIDASNGDHYNLLLEQLGAANQSPSLVLHAWRAQRNMGDWPLERQMETGLFSVLHLALAWSRRRIKEPLTICFVHAEATPCDEMVDGFLRSLNLEFPSIQGTTIQIRERDDLLGLIREPHGVPNAQARRTPQGWEVRGVQELTATTIPRPQFRTGGAYLITGGLGGIGKILASYLATKYSARLLLCGRTELSSENAAFLDQLNATGATVSYSPCDLSDPRQVLSLVKHAKTLWGELNGVFHCAGILKDGALARKSVDQFETVLRPKVLGASNLDAATAGEALDFFVLFSSITSLTGNRGQTDYASANRFLDSFAGWREIERASHRRSGKTISINWPFWAEGGMTLPAPLLARMRDLTGMAPLPSALALSALEQAISLGHSQLGIFFGDAPKIRELLKIAEKPDAKAPAVSPASNGHSPLPEEAIQKGLVAILAEALKFSPEEFDPDTELSEYGVDSITAMDILNRCEARFDRTIDPSAIVQFPSIRSFARHLAESGASSPESSLIAPQLERAVQRGDAATIAIIGLACRLPSSPNVEAYWDNLKNGRTLVTEAPPDRWRLDDYYSADKSARGKSCSKWGAFIDDYEMFDPGFFNIGEIDARVMDPQHRILLELSEELFRDAGYGRNEIKGRKIGIFIGGGESSYLAAHLQNLTDEELKHLVVNSAGNMMAARISDFYDLRGPASVIDTACSSSLVSVHTACQSIRSGECDWAIAGGAQLLPDQGPFVAFSKAGVLAADGVPRVFDRNSKGFVLGEGLGLVLLKPLDAALRDGDDIRALILGSAVNNDGHTMGITTPNMQAQSDVLRLAYEKAGIRPSSISMLEAHGTGTLLGDPIEIKAATEVFRGDSQEVQFCAVGSVKSNLGHLLRAAGIASVLKVVLALRHKQIPPTLHCQDPHPRFRFEESPFFPVRKLQAFPRRDGVRRAAVSSFGFGGTNCHIAFEEFVGEKFDFKLRRAALAAPRFQRRRFSFAAGAAEIPVLKTNPPSVSTNDLIAPEKPAISSELNRAIEKLMVQRAARLLSVAESDIPTQTNFMDLGIDSVALVDLAQQLEQEIQIELYPTLFFEYQNIEALAEYFAREHASKFAAFLGMKETAPRYDAPAPHPKPVRASIKPAPEKSTRDIAIIGMAGRFSGSADLDQFWKNLHEGKNLIQEIPADHFDYRPSFDVHPQAPNKLYCKWGSFLEEVDKFDAAFFRVSEREAELMDPQMRILLEVMHSAAENAGLAGRIRGTRTGVYVGACFQDYGQEIARTGKTIDPFDGTGNAPSMLANRPSFFWNLRGPSLTVDTACSSSLVALHLACRALREGECEMAFASGVNLALSPFHFIYFCSIGALSPTGRCHSFDARADGYVPGEAIASVLLKPLDQAIADGDPIHGVIKGTAVNHGGYTNTVTAPNPQMEAEVLAKAWEDAGIDPATLSYIEAHGTGTKLGDPVEIQGIKLAFKQFTDRKGFCAIGSAKAHIGHTESAAGIAGLIKTVLSMKNRCIPSMPDFKELNPLIQLKDSPLYINTAPQLWSNADHGVLRAGVSSFGFGGTYAHAVLESYEPAPPVPRSESGPELFVFSAKSNERLDASLRQFSTWLQQPDSRKLSLRDIAFTLQTGREPMEHRLAFIAADHSEAICRLEEALRAPKPAGQCLRGSAERNPTVRIGLSPEDLRYFEDLHATGQLEKLAALWIWGAEIQWHKLRTGSDCQRIPLPAYPFERKSFWFLPRAVASEAPAPLAPLPAPLAAATDVRSFVTNAVARLVNVSASAILPTTDLEELGFDSIMGMQLMKEIQENFNVRFYPSEAQMRSSFGALLDYLDSQITPPRADLRKPMVFILSTPRSGSTLLRVMLAGHSRIFCPPELHLLPFSTLEERSKLLSARAPFLSEGLPRAIMELQRCDANAALATISEWQGKHLSIPQTYEALQLMAGERLLIDKSPSYGDDLKALEQSREWFPDAKYILLYRHPFAVMESYVRNRFDKLFQQKASDPWQIAADVWFRINRNLLALRDQLPASNYCEIRYEDLVAAPEVTGRKLCEFLEIPFETALLSPYEGKRMTDGLRPVSLSIGDPNFNEHREIDPALAESWRKRLSQTPELSPEALALAGALGYKIESAPTVLIAPAQAHFLRFYQKNPVWNLEHRLHLQTAQPFDRKRLEAAWRTVIARHPAFRTCFRPETTEIIRQDFAKPFTISESSQNRSTDEFLAAMHSSLNLSEPPLIRFGITELGEGKCEWLCVYHHLIGDGVSSSLLFEEVVRQYFSPSSPPPYEHGIEKYSQAVNDLLARAGVAHESFWSNYLGKVTPLALPLDNPSGPPLFSTEVELCFSDAELGMSDIPPFGVCSVALAKAIAEWTGSEDVIISHRLHGRRAAPKPAEDPIGCFAIDVPFRFKGSEADVPFFQKAFAQIPSNGITYTQLALDGQLPFAHALTPVRLNYQPRPLLAATENFKVLFQSVRPVQAPEQQRLYLLDFIVRAEPLGWSLLVRYSTPHHREATVRKVVELWRCHVTALFRE